MTATSTGEQEHPRGGARPVPGRELFTLLIWLADGAAVEESTTLAQGGDFGQLQLLGLWGLLFVSLLGARVVARRVARGLSSTERCLVLGGADAAGRVDQKLRAARSLDAIVAGRVPLEARSTVPGRRRSWAASTISRPS